MQEELREVKRMIKDNEKVKKAKAKKVALFEAEDIGTAFMT